MKFTSESILKLLDTVKGSYLEAFYGLVKIKRLKHENPDSCAYVRKAETIFYESGEYDKLIGIIKQILEENERSRQ